MFGLEGTHPCPSVQGEEVCTCSYFSPQTSFNVSLHSMLFSQSLSREREVKHRTSLTAFKIRRVQKNKTACLIGSLKTGQRSYFLIRHLQKLGVHVPGALPFLVEQKLVVAAVSTDGCRVKTGETRTETESQVRPLQSEHQN